MYSINGACTCITSSTAGCVNRHTNRTLDLVSTVQDQTRYPCAHCNCRHYTKCTTCSANHAVARALVYLCQQTYTPLVFPAPQCSRRALLLDRTAETRHSVSAPLFTSDLLHPHTATPTYSHTPQPPPPIATPPQPHPPQPHAYTHLQDEIIHSLSLNDLE